MAGYNLTRTVEDVLDRFDKDNNNLPSFTVHLHVEYWTLNNGSKFLYNNPVASLLDDIRAHRIPVDFLELFDSAKVPFYDGCMIVELLDYRPQKLKEPAPESPERTRVVLHPNSETLWADICLLNQKTGNQFTDQDALEIEARLLMATAPPLCLDPDPHLTRIANNVLRVSTPTVPVSLKRKASAALDTVEDETDKAKRAKWMQFMNPRQHRSHAPNYRILEIAEKMRNTPVGPPTFVGFPNPIVTASAVNPTLLQNTNGAPVQNGNGSVTPQPPPPSTSVDPAKKQKAKKVNGDNRSTATPTPVNGGPTINQYMPHLQPNAHHSPSPVNQPLNQSNAPVQGQQQYGQPLQQVSAQTTQPLRPTQPGQPQPGQPMQTVPNYPQQTQFLTHVPPQRNVQPKPGSSPAPPAAQGTPQQVNATPVQNGQHPQMAMYPPHVQAQMQAAAAAQQRLSAGQNQNGRVTPSRSPMNPNATTAQRNGGGANPPPPNSRSPMPPNAQAIPQMTHPSQHPNFAMTQSQFNMAAQAQIRAQFPNAAHMANGGSSNMPQGQTPEQQHAAAAAMMQQYPMYTYPGVPPNYQMRPGQMPPGSYASWPMSRGMPVNGQMPGMAPNGVGAHPQQMLNVGKAVPGGMPGR